jgi:MFS family permease
MLVSLLFLLIATILLELGNGLLGVLVPIQGERAGFSVVTLGSLGTLYYFGFVVGCMFLPRIIRRYGHIRSFAAFAALGSSAALIHALAVAPLPWLALRGVVGLSLAGLLIVVESWLNNQAVPQTRGHVFGLYMAATWFGIVGGQLLFAIPSSETFQLFAVVAIAISLSLVPVTLTTGAVPSIPQVTTINLVGLYRLAPVGLIGCLAVGLANGAFWTFAPLFARAWSGTSLGVSLFMSAAVIGGALSQWPIGRFSDRVDRRWVIAAVCLASAAVALSLLLGLAGSTLVFLGLTAVFGAFALSLYPLCVAHVNDRADPEASVEVSSRLLMVFGFGAIVGPFLASFLIAALGIASLLGFIAAIHVALGIYTLSRIMLAKPVPEPERTVFTPSPPLAHATQAVVELQQGVEEDFDAERGAAGRSDGERP